MLDKASVDRFNELFDEYLELEDQKAHVRDGQKFIKEEMTIILEESKGIVGKVISYLVKQRSKGEDEIGKIYEIIEALES